MMLSNLRTDLNHLVSVKSGQRAGGVVSRSISFNFFRRKKKPDEDRQLADQLASGELAEVETKESMWDDLTQEQIDKACNRSKLTVKERDRLRGELSERVRLTELYQYKTDYVRGLYATFGKESGLKPGVCWPRKQELEFRKKYEAAFHPPLGELMKQLADEKASEAEAIAQREKEIRKGLKKLDKYKKEFFTRYNQIQSEIKEKENKEAKRIEEINDFLGFELSPSDPRFEAAAQKKAEIDRKEMLKTGIVKKTKQQRMLEELQKLIEENQKAEQKAAQDTESEQPDDQASEQAKQQDGPTDKVKKKRDSNEQDEDKK